MKAFYNNEPERLMYMPLPNGKADVWLRKNIEGTTDEDGGAVWTADEVYFRTKMDKDSVEANFEALYVNGRETEEPCDEPGGNAGGDGGTSILAALQTIMTKDQALQMSRLLEIQADGMEDGEIVNYPDFVEKWNGNGETYEAGKRISYNGVIYKVNQAHISQPDWTPDAAASLYSKMFIPDDKQIYPWEQPGSTNPYMKGDKATHNGKTWESLVDNNVWEPGAVGTEALWKEIK